MLGFVFEQSSNKEENFVKQIVELGYVLPISVSRARLQSTGKDMHFVGIRALCEHLAVNYPEKLLAGHTSVNKDKFHDELRKFWSAFRIYNGGHDVYSRWGHQLHLCIPAKFHMDEGTGQRKLRCSNGRGDQWFCITIVFRSVYVLRQHCSRTIQTCSSRIRIGERYPRRSGQLTCGWGSQSLSWWVPYWWNWTCALSVGGSRRRPARAGKGISPEKKLRLPSHELCPWCLCNDRDVPHTDHRQGAIWRTTVHQRRPWTVPGPLNCIPGADHESFLAKDLFHLCHLGIVRTFAVNMLCYLTHLNIFVARILKI